VCVLLIIQNAALKLVDSDSVLCVACTLLVGEEVRSLISTGALATHAC